MKKVKRVDSGGGGMFFLQGLHNARMEEIAAVAGIGKGTIYEYFPSKLQLFQDMLNKKPAGLLPKFQPGRDEAITRRAKASYHF